MSRHLHRAPSSSLINGAGGGGASVLHNGNMHTSVPLHDPAANLDATEAADDAPSMPSSFSILAALRQQNLRSWPRQRRRDSKSPHPTTTSASSSQLALPFTPESTTPQHHPHHQPQPCVPPSRSAFLHHRSQDTEKQPKRPRQRPYPLNDSQQRHSPSRSPPLLPSPPPSIPSVTDLPKDVEQLAGELSRQHLQQSNAYPDTCRRPHNGHASGNASGNGSGRASGRDSSVGSAAVSRNGSRYRDAMASACPSMELRLRNGGNAPVNDLEVDMDQDNRNDNGDCQLRLPSPVPVPSYTPYYAPSAAPSQSLTGAASSYAVSTDLDSGPSVPLSLLRMRRRQAAMADASVRHLNLGLTPFARQISPDTDESLAPQHTAESTPEMTDVSTVTTTATTEATASTASAKTAAAASATPAPIGSSTGAGAFAAASPIEANDEDLPSPPHEAMAIMNPYPLRASHMHSRSLSRSYHSQSLSMSRSVPYSHPHSRDPSISMTGASGWNVPPVDCLPLSPESLAMPHLARLHHDVPSSGYDMQGWLRSSSTVEYSAALTTGTIDPDGRPVSTDVLEPDDAPVEEPPATIAATATDAMAATKDEEAALRSSQASLRRQQSRQFYTAYLRPHHVPFYQEMAAMRSAPRGRNPPVDVLEADIEAGTETNMVRIVQADDSASASVLASSQATPQGNDDTTTPQPGQYMGYSERIRLLQIAMAREERARSQKSVDGSSTVGSVIVAGGDMMDVDMVDPTAMGDSSSHSSIVRSAMLGSLPSLPESVPSDFHQYMGPFRYRLSSEVAMRCTNLVRNKPRMRRRRQPIEGSETNDGGSSLRGSSINDGASSLHSDRRSERRRELRKERVREGRTSRDPSGEPDQDGRERRSRISRHREQSRLSQVSLQALAQVQAQVQAQIPAQTLLLPHQLRPPLQGDDVAPPVPDPACTVRQQQHPQAEQHPLPVWRPPVPEPIEAIDVDTS